MAVAEWVVHDVASMAWEETVLESPYYLPQTTVPGTGPPEECVGKVIDREIKVTMPPRPSEADVAVVDASGMQDVLSDYGAELMHNAILEYAMRLTPPADFSGDIVRDIQTAVLGARGTALRHFYTGDEGDEGDDDDEGDEGDESDESDEDDSAVSPESMPRDDRRALFARLSAAIEAAQPRLRDSEYKELYDAAKAIHDAP